MASPTKELRSLLSEYLAGSLKPGEFSERFAVVSSAAHRAKDVAGQELCRAVGWAFLDRKREFSSQEQLLQALADLASEPQYSVVVGSPVILGNAHLCSDMRDDTSSTLRALPASVLMARWQVSLETEYA